MLDGDLKCSEKNKNTKQPRHQNDSRDSSTHGFWINETIQIHEIIWAFECAYLSSDGCRSDTFKVNRSESTQHHPNLELGGW